MLMSSCCLSISCNEQWLCFYISHTAREDRYHHDLSDEDDDEEEVPELGNFSSCSPRFSRIMTSNDPFKDDDNDHETSFADHVERQDSDSSYCSMRRTDSDTE